MSDETCPLCHGPAQNTPISHSPIVKRWECKTCGTFRVEHSAFHPLRSDPRVRERLFLLSAYAKEGRDVLIDGDLLERVSIGELREKTVPEKMRLVLRYFTDGSQGFGEQVTSDPEHNYPLAWCRSPREWRDLVTMLVQERKFLDGASGDYMVTFKGWEWLDAKPAEMGRTAFVAMNFADEYRDLQKAITTAIDSAGYDPKVVNEDLFTGGIMDRVVARIREARFIVADYTGNRGGVYYEAGFALGLGKTVFHSCENALLKEKDPSKRLHFDVAHLKMIDWCRGNLPDYSKRLEEHILAVLGRGPLKQKSRR